MIISSPVEMVLSVFTHVFLCIYKEYLVLNFSCCREYLYSEFKNHFSLIGEDLPFMKHQQKHYVHCEACSEVGGDFIFLLTGKGSCFWFYIKSEML